MLDPLVEALVTRNAYTPSDIARAIRYRQEQVRVLEAEMRALQRLLSPHADLAEVQAERDPPIGAP